jgi:predicted RecA/RadA family phage recombinase
MATNRKFRESENTTPLIKCTAADSNPVANKALSGDPVVIGQIPGVALMAADSGLKTVVQLDGVFELLVAGIDSSGALGADANVAVLGGDKVYFDKTKNPPLSKRAGGIFFGYAYSDAGVQVVAAGSTTTKINVKVGAGG